MVSLRDLEWAYEDAEQAFIEAYLSPAPLEKFENEFQSYVKSRRRAEAKRLKSFRQASLQEKIKMVPELVDRGRYRYKGPSELCGVALEYVKKATIYQIAKSKGIPAAIMYKLTQ